MSVLCQLHLELKYTYSLQYIISHLMTINITKSFAVTVILCNYYDYSGADMP